MKVSQSNNIENVVQVEEWLQLKPRSIYALFMRQPKSFWCACGYLIFEYVRPQTIYPALAILPWPLLFIVLGAFFSYKERTPVLPAKSVEKIFYALSFVVFLASLFALDAGVSFSRWKDYFLWVIIFVVVRRCIVSREQLFLFLMVFFLANFKMSQHGFLTWAGRGFAFADWGVSGAPGFFENSGEFGIQLCIFVPMIACFMLALYSNWSRFIKLGMLLLPFTGLASAVATSSRGALVGMGMAAVWLVMKSKYRVRALIAGGLIGIVIYTNIPQESMHRFQNAGDDHTSLHRLERWTDGWTTMKRYPVFGVGPHNWDWYYRVAFNPKYSGPTLVHNVFVQAGTELGFMGITLFLMLILACFISTAKVRRLLKEAPDPFLLSVSNGLDAALVGLMVSASFVTVFYYPYFWIHALLVVCLRNVVFRHVAEFKGVTDSIGSRQRILRKSKRISMGSRPLP